METLPVTLQVDDAAARAYLAASPEEQKKVATILGIQFERLVAPGDDSLESLRALMDQIGREAEERGMTQEILDSILNDES